MTAFAIILLFYPISWQTISIASAFDPFWFDFQKMDQANYTDALVFLMNGSSDFTFFAVSCLFFPLEEGRDL